MAGADLAHGPKNAAGAAATPADRAFAQQVRMLYEGAVASQAVALVVAGVVAWSIWEDIDRTVIVVWLLSLTLASIARFLLALAYRRRVAGTALQPAAWRSLFVLGVAVSGAIWGCAGIYLLPLPAMSSHVMVIVAFAGIAAAAVPYLAPRLGAYCAFSVPMLSPAIVRLLLQHDPMLEIMGLVTALFLAGMIFVAWRTHKTIATVLALQYQNEDLIEHLESANTKLSSEIQERRKAENSLGATVSVLRATLDATAEGVLVIDFAGNVVSYNRHFLEMWKVPEELLDARRAETLLQHLANQLHEPEVFLARVRELYRTRSEEPRIRLEFTDGKIFERLSVPYSISGEAVGRVWTFRVITERRHGARAPQAHGI